MITVGDAVYFMDMGTDVVTPLRTRHIPIQTVKAVFITHMHGDHTNGLIPFVDICSWYFRDAAPAIYLPELGPVEQLRGWLKCNGTDLRKEITFAQVQEGTFYNDGTLQVTAFRTQHTGCSYAYLVEAEGKRVLFTGDLCHKGPQEDFPVSTAQNGNKLELAICETAHFDATAYAPVMKELTIDRVVINHYQPILLAGIFELEKMLAPTPVELATDDMEIVL